MKYLFLVLIILSACNRAEDAQQPQEDGLDKIMKGIQKQEADLISFTPEGEVIVKGDTVQDQSIKEAIATLATQLRQSQIYSNKFYLVAGTKKRVTCTDCSSYRFILGAMHDGIRHVPVEVDTDSMYLYQSVYDDGASAWLPIVK